MDVFSLEDDEAINLFLTQEANNVNASDNENSMELGVCDSGLLQESKEDGSVDKGAEGYVKAIYSDILDPEDDFVDPVYGRGLR